jgi:hypothetical protein
MDLFIEKHSGELLILILSAMVLLTLLILVPQILRAHYRARELQHAENMRALEQGQTLPPPDERSRAAARTAALVPMVVVCTAGTVTCFLVSFKAEQVFAVSVAVWAVSGVIGLAAITVGGALMGRLAQLGSEADDGDWPEEPKHGKG